jgi:hypothetical protein
MNEKQIFKSLAYACGVGFIAGMGSMVAVANILGWW